MRSGADIPGLTEGERALVVFVRKATADPHKMMPADIDRLRAVGWDEPAIVEALSMAMLAGFTNTLSIAMHLDWDLERFGMKGYF